MLLDRLELWGGIECTLNRVGDSRFDQIARTGHDSRPGDLEKFAALEIRAIRYPVLWERVAPNGLEWADWRLTDSQLGRLGELAIKPIVGLLHHGSGPDGTSLIDPEFPSKFAEYALTVARRYPWIDIYTPINEPLTTARFSGLYGHWHPHATNDLIFARVLLNQCRAIVLAMAAIRTVNPKAKLLVTEDVAPTHSTRALAYQAEFENARRWSSLDLLAGLLTPQSRIGQHLVWLGVPVRDVEWFLDNPCPPDMIGIDYYPSSERFLDENWERYPLSHKGGNGQCNYADVEAVRVRREGIAGHLSIIQESWMRYGVPIALTECHIACSVDEQIRWFYDSWHAAERARGQGIPVEGVTLWSMLGAFDWDSLCTHARGYYEPGAFDISSGVAVPTKLAHAATEISLGNHRPKLKAGWWARPDRLLYEPISAPFRVKHLEQAEASVEHGRHRHGCSDSPERTAAMS